MSEVTDLSKVREQRNPQLAGAACCAGCGHVWAALIPKGTNVLECPECHTMKGRMIHPVLLEEGKPRVQCVCGCQMFMLDEVDAHCVNCGDSFIR